MSSQGTSARINVTGMEKEAQSVDFEAPQDTRSDAMNEDGYLRFIIAQYLGALGNEQATTSDPSFNSFLDSFKARRNHVKKLKAVLESLNGLTTSLEGYLIHAEYDTNTRAMNLGLARLPDEILDLILQYATTNFEEACQVSQVCVRFRVASHSSPKLWANCPLTLHLTPKQATAIAKRSGRLLLKARIEPVPYAPLRTTCIINYSTRLQDLYISPINDPVLYGQFRALQLPSLRCLSMRWSELIQRQSDNISISRIYQTWSMPHLVSVDANFAPRPIPGTRITICKITIEGSVYVSQLLNFLASTPLLETLDISLLESSAWLESRPYSVVELPSLHSLSLTICCKTPPTLLSHILSHLSCKKLYTLSIVLDDTFRTDEMHNNAFGFDMIGGKTEMGIRHIKLRSDEVNRFMRTHNHIRKLLVDVTTTKGRGDQQTVPSHSLDTLRHLLQNLPSGLEIVSLPPRLSVYREKVRDYSVTSPPIDHIRIAGGDEATITLLRVLKEKAIRDGLEPRRVDISRSAVDLQQLVRDIFPNSEFILTNRN